MCFHHGKSRPPNSPDHPTPISPATYPPIPTPSRYIFIKMFCPSAFSGGPASPPGVKYLVEWWHPRATTLLSGFWATLEREEWSRGWEGNSHQDSPSALAGWRLHNATTSDERTRRAHSNISAQNALHPSLISVSLSLCLLDGNIAPLFRRTSLACNGHHSGWWVASMIISDHYSQLTQVFLPIFWGICNNVSRRQCAHPSALLSRPHRRSHNCSRFCFTVATYIWLLVRVGRKEGK